MESFAGPELMIPEQVWDRDDLPAKGLFKGKGTGSAAPLGWAHAAYLGLLCAISGATLPDLVAPARRRYSNAPRPDPAYVWSHSHQITSFRAGRSYLNLIAQPAERKWSWWGRVIFYHSDIDALHAHVIAAGYRPDTVPHDAEWGERFFHLTDPDGHELSFAWPRIAQLPDY